MHTKVVIPFFQAHGATHCRHVHGSFERGKDVVFLMPDNIVDDPQLAVCQVKNEKLTGRAGGHSSAHTVLNQLLQCKETEVVGLHHEAPAFNITHSRLLSDFFVNLSVSHSGSVLERIAAGEWIARSPKRFELPKYMSTAYESLYFQIADRLHSDGLFTISKERAPQKRRAVRGANESDRVGTEVPHRKANRLDHTTFTELRFKPPWGNLWVVFVSECWFSSGNAGRLGCYKP